MDRATYTVEELRALTGMSESHIRDEAHRAGGLPVVSMDPMRFSKAAVDRWLAAEDWQPIVAPDVRHNSGTTPALRLVRPVGTKTLDLDDVFAEQDAERAQRKEENRRVARARRNEL